ncbi:lipid II:glycine glycyltransferase FemX [Mycoplana dimorpha]|uniref:Lipid II:glycine glycyltransferase (Peptidoglycan interpeptide bridge formation enzyme) n=1 Tax=Mycoplana dimorpha TaxID=28320 RepID=A0A2T5BFA4_MYCDI|nr:GNAT family N-acetyltransferase [Mycoplana dimorpha]PTM97655.1 lipid II:glycine glycyltransferase (peptidoglycan interpeptide bridge formation enzyme) [Mycoplana dimorpha]
MPMRGSVAEYHYEHADVDDWRNWLRRAPVSYVGQSDAYGEGKATQGWSVSRVVFRNRNRAVAACQIQERRIAGILVVSRVHQGPLFFDSNPSPDVVLGVYRALRKGWGRLWTGPLVISPALVDTPENRKILRLAGYRKRSDVAVQSALLDLNGTEGDLFARLSSNFRNRCRKAEKAGVTVDVSNSPEVIDWLVRNNINTLSAKNVFANTVEFYQAVARAAGDDFFVLRALHGDEPVGGAIFLRTGNTTKYEIGWRCPKAHNLYLGYALMWNAIKEARRRGAVLYDVGGLGDAGGFTRFKREMKGREYQLIGDHIGFDLPDTPSLRLIPSQIGQFAALAIVT